MKLLATLSILIFSFSAFSMTDNSQCKSFLLSTNFLGYKTTYEKICTSNTDFELEMTVTVNNQSVSVDSETLISNEVDVKKSISHRITEGLSKEDSKIIVNKIAPALKAGDIETAQVSLNELILGR